MRFVARVATTLTVVSALAFGAALPAAAQSPVPATTQVPAKEAKYFQRANLDDIWMDLESQGKINKRVLDEGKFSINIRTIRVSNLPLIHGSSIDIWIVDSGTATAITGGILVNPRKHSVNDDLEGDSISGGTEHLFSKGDILYIPAGVAHGFQNAKNFRAYLIRISLK